MSRTRESLANDAWQDHIVIAPDIHHGAPCIKGTRIPVSIILGSLADGMTPEQIREAYPQLTLEDIRAAGAVRQDALLPLPKGRDARQNR